MRTQRRRIGQTAAIGLLAAAVVAGAGLSAVAKQPDPGNARTSHRQERAVAAERKGGGFRTVKKTFTNGAAVSVPGAGADDSFGAADPYPAAVQVGGFRRARVADLNLTLHNFSHAFPADVAVLLVAPGGRSAVVMADVGGLDLTGPEEVTDITLTLDDEAAGPLPVDARLTTGTFRPRDGDQPGPDGELVAFPAPAPTPSGDTALATFDGIDPNGRWQLFILDDDRQDAGSLAGGWSLEVAAKAKKKRR